MSIITDPTAIRGLAALTGLLIRPSGPLGSIDDARNRVAALWPWMDEKNRNAVTDAFASMNVFNFVCSLADQLLFLGTAIESCHAQLSQWIRLDASEVIRISEYDGKPGEHERAPSFLYLLTQTAKLAGHLAVCTTDPRIAEALTSTIESGGDAARIVDEHAQLFAALSSRLSQIAAQATPEVDDGKPE